VLTLADEQLAERIRAQRIDILIDLSLHTANNRLLLFARKPAPVQVSYLGYAGTSGMAQVDYRLTDPHLDPCDREPPAYSEESFALKQTYWCFYPHPSSPDVNALPAAAAGHLTFACLNKLAKVTPQAIEAWSEILRRVARSRLILSAPPGRHRDEIRRRFAGVDADRIEFIDRLPMRDYLEIYHRVDIALDTFPFNGATCTCESLWMGVPIVTLAGEIASARAGKSILSNAGLMQFIGKDVESYIRIACDSAADLPALAALRGAMRDRLQRSPLRDAASFTKNVEDSYRAMWRRWCESSKQSA
jgi:predicted O-linked N-acetylglucosamine transferase (SPINDLY family)